jgi:glycosyltransferase involved in cell wall biosynthesis
MQRVLYILNALGGGASAGIYEMLPHLPKDQYAVYAVAPPSSNPAELERARRHFIDIRTFPMNWWNIPDVDPIRAFARLISERRHGATLERATEHIKRAIREWGIDLVHTGTALTLGGALAARELNIPHVWHIKESVGSQNRVKFRMSDTEMVAYFSDHAAQIIAMSDYIAEVFRQHGCKNISVIPDGVDLTPYQTGDSRNLRARLKVNETDLLIGMVAGLNSTWKQHDVFVKAAAIAAKQNPDLRFVILGGKSPARARFPYDTVKRYADEITRLAEKLFPDGRLQILEHVPDPPDIMRSLDVLVHPCDVEPFGRIGIEAMAAGTPVIGATTGGIAETVTDGKTGLLVTPKDEHAFAEAILRLASDANLRSTLGSAGKIRVQGRYTIEGHVEKLGGVYMEALSHIGT